MRGGRWAVACGLILVWLGAACAAVDATAVVVPATVSVGGPAGALPPAPDPAAPADPAPRSASGPAARSTADSEAQSVLRVFNRPVAVFRASMYGALPAERSRRAVIGIADALAQGGPGRVDVEATPVGTLVRVDGRAVFFLLPGDVDRERGESLEQAIQATAGRLEGAIEATRASRDVSQLVRGAGQVAAATAIAALLVWALGAATRWAGRRLLRLASSGAERLKLAGTEVVQLERMHALVGGLVRGVYWVLLTLVLYEWVSTVLASFAYTRPWADGLNHFLIDVLLTIGSGVLHALPDLMVATVIFVLAGVFSRVLSAFLERAARAPGTLTWLDVDTVRPARRLVTAAVWLFALAMAYPYLPGSQTEAFRGLSVLLGLMISLGGSSLFGQAASGLVLMYTRTLRVGEYVRIDGDEGTVVEMGTFTTRVRTGLGEELSLPNSLVMGSVTRNYSRAVQGGGFIVDTVLTIGYDTPWRQVHAMLIEAAGRTPGVLTQPAPRVFQTGLSDFYPEYRLVCQALPSEPRPRAEVMSALHANIQDVFNTYGVQIMSPHYLGDPGEAKRVPPERWFVPPAVRPPEPPPARSRDVVRQPPVPHDPSGD